MITEKDGNILLSGDDAKKFMNTMKHPDPERARLMDELMKSDPYRHIDYDKLRKALEREEMKP